MNIDDISPDAAYKILRLFRDEGFDSDPFTIKYLREKLELIINKVIEDADRACSDEQDQAIRDAEKRARDEAFADAKSQIRNFLSEMSPW